MSAPVAFSIVIPTHARPTLLPRAVQSALQACGAQGEVVVVADSDPGVAASLSDLAADPQLRIVHNMGPRGASGARNHGVAVARGEIVFFLDDDDEIIADYPRRVMPVAQARQADWGFSRHLTRIDETTPPEPASRKKRRRGVIPPSAPFKRNVAATSNGFWIRRDLCRSLGGFCTDMRLDEDTDLCCHLVGAGHRPWYEEDCGMILNRDDAIERLTSTGQAQDWGRCYLKTLQRGAEALHAERGAISFLAFRAQRMLMQAGMTEQLPLVYREVPWMWLRLALQAKRTYARLFGATE